MTATLTYTLGRFVWRELFTQDVPAAKRFYGAMFGWTFEDSPMGPEFVYTIIKSAGKRVGGMMAIADLPAAGPAVPPHWASYVSVADVDATAKQMVDAGAKVLGACHDIPGVGRFAVVQDPQGACLNLFRSVNGDPEDTQPEAGEFCWENLAAPDPEKAAAYYGELIGWGTEAMPGAETILFSRKSERGSLTLASLGRSHDDSSHWLPFVAVEDIAATVAQARSLGGSVLVEPTEIPAMGAFAIMQDPQGVVIAAFSGNCT